MTAFLQVAFRPFFLAAFGYAFLLLGYWGLQLAGWVAFASPQPVFWHAHEMLFGFAAAGVGGFLFTAIANWTNRRPVAGLELGALVGCWLLGRLAMNLQTVLPPVLVGLLDLAYLGLASILLGRELILGRNRRNYLVLGLVLLLLACNLGYHLADPSWRPGWSHRSALLVVLSLLTLIGGRITPGFTRNWLRMRKPGVAPPVETPRLDEWVLGVSLACVPLWGFFPQSVPTGLMLALGGVLHLARLARWQGMHVLGEPLLWVLHLGALWFAGGLLLLGFGVLLGWPPGAGTHALTIGAVSTMIAGVGTRVSLGHSGRQLTASRSMALGYGLLSVAAALRIAESFVGGWLYWAAGAYLLAFACLLVALLPMLFSRPDDSR